MTYEIDWPPEVIEWFNQFAIFENLDILKLVAMDCLFKTDYLFSLKFQTLSKYKAKERASRMEHCS